VRRAAASTWPRPRPASYFKLFPLIGRETDGLDAYARFVCALVSGRSKATQTQKGAAPALRC
jgi:hypothetical protein